MSFCIINKACHMSHLYFNKLQNYVVYNVSNSKSKHSSMVLSLKQIVIQLWLFLKYFQYNNLQKVVYCDNSSLNSVLVICLSVNVTYLPIPIITLKKEKLKQSPPSKYPHSLNNIIYRLDQNFPPFSRRFTT